LFSSFQKIKIEERNKYTKNSILNFEIRSVLNILGQSMKIFLSYLNVKFLSEIYGSPLPKLEKNNGDIHESNT
jgi:hypothetical protein